MKDKIGSPHDYNAHDICDLFENMMFPMPEKMSRGPGGRGCGRGRGRGRGPGRGEPGMGRGGRGCGRGPHGRPDPRQMPFEHCNQGAGVFEGPHGRPDPRQMPFIHGSHFYKGFDATQANEDTNKEDKEGFIREHFFFEPPQINRPPLMRRLRRLVSQMENTNGNSSGSDTNNSQDDMNNETKCDSERRNCPRRKCRRTWRRFMRRQLRKCPRHPVNGYGPPQAWRPPCAHPMAGGPPPCGPMAHPPMLPGLHRLLTALESEMNKVTNVGKDEGVKTANQESNHEEPTPRHARLQTRLRRLIAHTKQQMEENAQVLPPYPWMMRRQVGSGSWDAPCHMRRMLKDKDMTRACKNDTTNEDKPDKETEKAKDATEDEDIAMSTSGRDALDDWQDLLQDVEDIQDEQEDIAPQDPSELCQTCGCSIPA